MKKTSIVNFLISAAMICFISGVGAQEMNIPKTKDYRIERSMSPQAMACIECHKKEHPGLFSDWAASRHAGANITCLDCHLAEKFDPDVSQSHYKVYEGSKNQYGTKGNMVPISAVVTPKDCSRCHPDESMQYSNSKHANTLEIIWKIDPWLNKGMNSDFERVNGCYHCHGTILSMKGDELEPATWPNVGVGRINLDGSKGSCTSCHTRHRFSVMEARKPEACGQCHLGPDHPQTEIFMESKHGGIYTAFGKEYNWTAAPGPWTPGIDFRGPTCAVCHISGAGDKVFTSHDVTERLAWELQAPLTIRPSEFKPFPANTNWETERGKMQAVCMQCHGKTWTGSHFKQMDQTVQEYNDVYFKPAKAKMDELYAKGLLDDSRYFDERMEVEYYELWHHEGRRARMGAAMMAPDYSWWHGFYECKKRFNNFMEDANHMIQTGEKAYKAVNYPNATGSTEKPPQIFKK